jgi:hypothetical protein
LHNKVYFYNAMWHKHRLVYISVVIVISAIIIAISRCNTSNASIYKNIDNPTATYVGIQKCSTCHADVYNTYILTGMGQSWGVANKQKTAADFSPKKAIVYNKELDLYYKPYFDSDTMKIMEFKLHKGDTIHKLTHSIKYIIGSGQHTNSHIIEQNGYLYQAPITFYTQSKKWDMAPGFEEHNARFTRKIETECITCHNAYPQHVQGSLNKYSSVPLGINCERCHGPGSVHVAEREAGTVIDTSKQPDYSIVNPRRMSITQQNQLCERCHLQGVSALEDGHSFFDFMPSKSISEHWQVHLPNYNGANKMIMASHVERMKLSKCYQASNAMSCITCHNPHISVKYTPAKVYNEACKKCHNNAATNCTASISHQQSNGNNCYQCHMSTNKSIDIPHVAIHDHKIQKIPLPDTNKSHLFLGLVCYNNNNLTTRQKARGFIEYYERYSPVSAYLDSALLYLQGDEQAQVQYTDAIRIYFLQNNFTKVVQIAQALKAKNITNHWNSYRIGEAYLKLQQYNNAIDYLSQAIHLMPLQLDYRNKLAEAYIGIQQIDKAKEQLQFILNENINDATAQSTLGIIYLKQNNISQAVPLLNTAAMLNPLHINTLRNLAVAYYQSNNYKQAQFVLKNALILEPNNTVLKAMLQDVQQKY